MYKYHPSRNLSQTLCKKKNKFRENTEEQLTNYMYSDFLFVKSLRELLKLSKYHNSSSASTHCVSGTKIIVNGQDEDECNSFCDVCKRFIRFLFASYSFIIIINRV